MEGRNEGGSWEKSGTLEVDKSPMSSKPLNLLLTLAAHLSLSKKRHHAPTFQRDIFSSTISNVGKQTLGNR